MSSLFVSSFEVYQGRFHFARIFSHRLSNHHIFSFVAPIMFKFQWFYDIILKVMVFEMSPAFQVFGVLKKTDIHSEEWKSELHRSQGIPE